MDDLAVIRTENKVALWANRAIILFLILFALSVPHSIAASQISFGLGLIAWSVRDLVSRRFHFARTPVDWPVACFAGLTILSSVFSVEPSLSLPKLKALTLFGAIYLLATNLHLRGVKLLSVLLVISGLVGVGFSLMEKLYGRGMVIAAIESDSPLIESKLHPGDVIWMIGRQRVYSPEGAANVIRRQPTGKKLDVEALHAGDPVPVRLVVTDELKSRPNPLGITASGRTRQFRVSGFSRQFLTYAEQMQIMALLAYGGLLAISSQRRRTAGQKSAGQKSAGQGSAGQKWFGICALLFALFGLGLVMTASRAVIMSFIGALMVVSISIGRRAVMTAMVATLTLGGLGIYVVTSARQQVMASFDDDSTARRIGYMRAGLKMIPQHPLLGVGMDSHKRHWQEWGFPGDYITHTHSTLIQIAMDRGLPALACYFWLIAATLIAAWRSHKRAKAESYLFSQGLSLGVFGAIVGFLLSSLTNYNFGDSEALMLLLFVIGLVLVAARTDQSA